MRILIVGETNEGDSETHSSKTNKLKDDEFLYYEDLKTAYHVWEQKAPKIIIALVKEQTINDAINLIETVRSKNSFDYTIIIVIASFKDEKARLKLLSLGVDDYLELPMCDNEIILHLEHAKKIISFSEKDALIYVISKLINLRDADAGHQGLNIPSYCKLVAEDLRKNSKYSLIINDRFIQDLMLFSTIHDIGKIGISDSILKKPDKFNESERDIMKMHTQIGADFIADIVKKYPHLSSLECAEKIIRWHHERVDGSGYPEGLKGDSIPLQVKIVAVCDVYDALISKRVYKKAFTHEEALQIIFEEEKDKYDKDVLASFKNVIENIKALSKKN